MASGPRNVRATSSFVIVEGSLKKLKSGLFGGWNEHWFRLTQQAGLCYFAKPKPPSADELVSPSGTIDIASGKYFRASSDPAVLYGVDIVIGASGTERTYTLSAASAVERDRWLRGLADWQSAQREAVVHFSSSVAAHPPAGPMPSRSTPQSNPPLILNSQASVATNTSLARASVAIRNGVAAVDLRPFQPLLDTFANSLLGLHTHLLTSASASEMLAVQQALFELMSVPAITASFIQSPEYSPSAFLLESAALPNTADNSLEANLYRVVGPQHHSLVKNLLMDHCSIAHRLLLLATGTETSVSPPTPMDSVAAVDSEPDILRALLAFLELTQTTRPFFQHCIEHEVQETVSEGTLFRANSAVTKLLTVYFRLHGSRWLPTILRSDISELTRSECAYGSLEVDPFKLEQQHHRTSSDQMPLSLPISTRSSLDVISPMSPRTLQIEHEHGLAVHESSRIQSPVLMPSRPEAVVLSRAGSLLTDGALTTPATMVISEAMAAQLDQNQQALVAATSHLLDALLVEADQAPLALRRTAADLQAIVERKFPLARQSSVGGLLFLRFLCPALLLPAQYDLLPATTVISSVARRRLVLITKLLQNLANCVRFGAKEAYMIPFNGLLDTYSTRVETFIHRFVQIYIPESLPVHSASSISDLAPSAGTANYTHIVCREQDLQILQRALIRFHIAPSTLLSTATNGKPPV